VYPYSYAVSLRAWHPSIEPDVITSAFGIPPKRTWRAGDARTTPKGTPLDGHYKETYWYADLVSREGGSSEACCFEEWLASLLEKFARYSDFIATLRASGGKAELFIGLFGDRNFGFVLPPRIFRALSDIGLALSFDIYPDPES
jgi:hypothetical protein